MNFQRQPSLCLAGSLLAALVVANPLTALGEREHSTLVITSTNDPSANAVIVFKLHTAGPTSLSLAEIAPTGGKGGASGNAGILQFRDQRGALANYGSNTVTELYRHGDFIWLGPSIHLAPDCVGPDSIALKHDHLFVVGTNCAESHAWPSGHLDGSPVSLSDNSAAQIAVGETWAAVTMKSGSVLQLPLDGGGGLSGASNTIALPSDADMVPLGAAFWGNILGFTPAHSPDSFAVVNEAQHVFPIAGPTPSFPVNAPCWVAKGPRSAWYTGNSPGQAVSIFFTDNRGGAFYKSISVPGVPTDITVSTDRKWLAVIYTASDGAHVEVFAINEYGGLNPVANSPAIGVASFNGVAFSQ